MYCGISSRIARILSKMMIAHGNCCADLFKILICLTLAVFGNRMVSSAQPGSDAVFNLLQKRYDKVEPWANGYIVSANTVHGLANASGRLVIPFEYKVMRPVFADRLIVCHDAAHGGCYIADERGRFLHKYDYGKITVLDSSRRLFLVNEGKYSFTINDHGERITPQYDTVESDGNLIPYSSFYNSQGAGILNRYGDTVLPPQYHSVSIGRKHYAAMRDDTVFVWRPGKGLLFKAASFHDCAILRNGFIAVKKYGQWALIDEQGKLLTGFEYSEIKDFRYPYSTMPRNRRGESPMPPAIPQYARVENGSSKGLIDATGFKKLPTIYEAIEMNTNGWMILRKAGHREEVLVDDSMRAVLSAEPYKITFLDNRYASIEAENYQPDETPPRTYDMQLRKFATVSPTYFRQESRNLTEPDKDKEEPLVGTKDSLMINRARTLLYRNKEGKWGVCSNTGDTILPFVYETVGRYNRTLFYVGKGKLHAALASDGDLLTPLGLDDIPKQLLADSLILLQHGEVYSYKGGMLRKTDPERERINDGSLDFQEWGVAVLDRQQGLFPPGIYNRKLERISTWKPFMFGPHPQNWITTSGLMAITDSTQTKVAVIDTSGKLRLSAIDKPRRFILRNEVAIAMGDTSQPDILYRLTKSLPTTETIRLDQQQKQQILYSYGDYHQMDLRFTQQSRASGIIMRWTGKVIPIKNLQHTISTDGGILLKADNKWGLLDEQGNILLTPAYDSVAYDRNQRFRLFLGSKSGVFDRKTMQLIPARFDSIYRVGSLDNHFVIARENGQQVILSENGSLISSGWDSILTPSAYRINGVPAYKAGRRFKLFASRATQLAAVPDSTLPPGAWYTYASEDGTAFFLLNQKIGLFDLIRNSWIIPPEYDELKEERNYFVAHTGNYSTGITYIFDPRGKEMFRLPRYYSANRMNAYHQWMMEPAGGA